MIDLSKISVDDLNLKLDDTIEKQIRLIEEAKTLSNELKNNTDLLNELKREIDVRFKDIQSTQDDKTANKT